MCVETEGRRSLCVKKFLGESITNFPNLKFLAIDAEGVYEGLILDNDALLSAASQLAALSSSPKKSGVSVLDLSQIFTENATSELVSRMLESLKGPERHHWIQIK